TERKEVTCGEFATHYFDALALGLGKAERTIERERGLWSRLEDHFSPMQLSEIKLTVISAYRIKREKEVTFVTCNRELGFVRYLLNLAVEDGVLEVVPRIRFKPEAGRARTRTLMPAEFTAILSYMGREQQRYYIGLWETSMRLREPTKLTWDKIDFKKNLI